MYFVHAGPRACLFTEWEGYCMRMKFGQLPTKMDDAQNPHSPIPMRIILRMSSHPVVNPQSTTVKLNNNVQIVKVFINNRTKIQ